MKHLDVYASSALLSKALVILMLLRLFNSIENVWRILK